MKVAFITGANRGLGAEIAKQLFAKGFQIIAGCRDDTEDACPDYIWRYVDYTDPDSFQGIFRSLRTLDVLVNNGGINQDPEWLRDHLDVNVIGPAELTAKLWDHLVVSGGRVINISSEDGLTSWSEDGRFAYAVSKAALNAVTRLLALRGERSGVSVCACTPGWCRTAMGGPLAPRTVREGAITPVWLASEADPKEINGKFFKDMKVLPW